MLGKLNMPLHRHPNTTTHLGGCWAGGRFVAALWGLAPARAGELLPHDVTMLAGVAVEGLLGPGSAGSDLTCGFTTALGRLAVSPRVRGRDDLRGVLRLLCAVTHWSAEKQDSHFHAGNQLPSISHLKELN